MVIILTYCRFIQISHLLLTSFFIYTFLAFFTGLSKLHGFHQNTQDTFLSTIFTQTSISKSLYIKKMLVCFQEMKSS